MIYKVFACAGMPLVDCVCVGSHAVGEMLQALSHEIRSLSLSLGSIQQHNAERQLDCIKRQYQLKWDTIELAPAICPSSARRKQATRQQKMDNKINRRCLKRSWAKIKG